MPVPYNILYELWSIHIHGEWNKDIYLHYRDQRRCYHNIWEDSRNSGKIRTPDELKNSKNILMIRRGCRIWRKFFYMQQSRFFLHYALLNTRDCIRKIRGQDGPLLYREHTPAMKKTSSDRRPAKWNAFGNTVQIWPKPRFILQSKLVIFFSPPNNFIVQIDETQKTKEKTHLGLLIQQKNRHSAHRKAHRQPNRF